MKSRSTCALAVAMIAAALASGACKEKGGNKELAKLCMETGNQLKTNSAGASEDTFKLMLSNALQACSGSCDDGADASCQELASHVKTICGVSPNICQSLCTSVKSPSLKKATCDFKK